jgi:Brp/Blh family beta-carotene 15,15'-monooxygenase
MASLAKHRHLMLGITAGVVTYGVAAAPPGTALQLALLAAAVALVGLPHGALDHLAARPIFEPEFGRTWWVVFGAMYLSLAALMALLWIVVPLPALCLFLTLSALHFGWDDPFWIDVSGRWWTKLERFSVGAMPIVLPTWSHPHEVTTIFNWLMPQRIVLDPGIVAAVAGCIAAAVLPVAGVRMVRLFFSSPSGGAAAAEIAAIATLHVAAPPLIAFLTYFCGWHSMRHALELADGLAPGRLSVGLRRFARTAAPLTAAAVTAALATAAVLTTIHLQPTAIMTTVIFVGLSVLTVPHMAVMAMARARRRTPQYFVPRR